jgi:hypothetical protein
MKKLILAGIITLGLSFAYAENKAATELEHQIKTAVDAESVGEDMSDVMLTKLEKRKYQRKKLHRKQKVKLN